MSDYDLYVFDIITQFAADTVHVPEGSEFLFADVPVAIFTTSGDAADARVVEFYASGVLVARAKLP